MSDAPKAEARPKVIRRRDGRRQLTTPQPLDSMDAAFAAIAQLTLG